MSAVQIIRDGEIVQAKLTYNQVQQLSKHNIEVVEIVDSKGNATLVFVDKEKQRLEAEKLKHNVSCIDEWLSGNLTDEELKQGIKT